MSPRRNARIAVLGGGAWGTALAHAMCASGNEVVLWARDADIVAAIRDRHENPRYLPGIPLDPAIRATGDAAAALAGADAALVVIPAQALRSALEELRPVFPPELVAVLCAKGIERATGLLPAEVAAEAIPGLA